MRPNYWYAWIRTCFDSSLRLVARNSRQKLSLSVSLVSSFSINRGMISRLIFLTPQMQSAAKTLKVSKVCFRNRSYSKWYPTAKRQGNSYFLTLNNISVFSLPVRTGRNRFIKYVHCCWLKSMDWRLGKVGTFGSHASTSKRGAGFISSYVFLVSFLSTFFSSSTSNSAKAYISLKILTLAG